MGDYSWICCVQHHITMKAFALVALLPALAFGAAPHHAGYGYEPQYYCRDTNTSIYAEVCVPAFTTETKPVVLNVKNVVDNDYCYTQIRTVCEETTKIEKREICTYNYESVREIIPAQTTQKTYETKSETMKVTTCKPSGYGDHYGAGEHQICHEEYQTQEYRVPLVNAPLEVDVELALPKPRQTCVTKDIELTEVVCNDIEEEKCFNVAELRDGTNTVDQTEVIIGEPNCNQVTLTLPTQACSKGYGHH